MRQGFTLIELVATTALSALLLLAGFKVIAATGRTRSALARQQKDRSYAPQAIDLLRWDLANACYLRTFPSELTVTGYDGLNAQTLSPTFRPVTVRYRIAPAGGQHWLVREETDLDVPTNHNRWSALVCSGISGFEVTTSSDRDPLTEPLHQSEIQEAPPHRTAAATSGWLGPEGGLEQPADEEVIPARVQVVLMPEEGQTSFPEEVLVTR